MRRLIRKLRGLLGTALTWAGGWGILGFGLTSLGFLFLGDPAFFWQTVLPVTVVSGMSGFVVGSIFSMALGSAYGRRKLAGLRPFRMALWGGIGGLVVPVALLGGGISLGLPIGDPSVAAGIVLAIGGLAGVTAGATVKLAQKSERALAEPEMPALNAGED